MAALKDGGEPFDSGKVNDLLFGIEAKIVRNQILQGEPRIDEAARDLAVGVPGRSGAPAKARCGRHPRVAALRGDRAAARDRAQRGREEARGPLKACPSAAGRCSPSKPKAGTGG